MRQLKQGTLANELFAIERNMVEIEALYKKELWPIEERREGLRKALLENLQQQGVKSVKLDDGTSYTRAQRTTLKVADEEAALVWAAANNSLKVDTTKGWKILKLTGNSDKL